METGLENIVCHPSPEGDNIKTLEDLDDFIFSENAQKTVSER